MDDPETRPWVGGQAAGGLEKDPSRTRGRVAGIPDSVDDITDRRNRLILKCGPNAPDTWVARQIRFVLAQAVVKGALP
jgi:hypothetical protein